MPIDIDRFKTARLLVVGDLMIDQYVWGAIERISPEAPVPVVAVGGETETLGGSGNVINNLTALGAGVAAVGVVGTDAPGDRLLTFLDAKSVDTRGIVRTPHRPTTRKMRIMAGSQHVLRIDRETRQALAPETVDRLIASVNDRIADVDAVIVSDYGKGVLTPKFLAALLKSAQRAAKPVIVDPKGRDFSLYSGASLITPNKKEAALAADIDIVDAESLDAAGRKLLADSGVARLLITCGKDGMVLFESGKAPLMIPAQARQVFDVSGAGDTVVAVFALALAAGADYPEAARLANTAAGIVVGKVGTATVSPGELAEAASPLAFPESRKIKHLDEIGTLCRDLKRAGKRIVMTNGCFDFLHAGHMHLFSASRRLGDVLIVAIDDDASVRALKGRGRPVIGQRERVRTLSAIESIDYVVVFPSSQLIALIESIQPDILTKGDNYSLDRVLGREAVEQFGGRVERIPVESPISTAAIIERIKNGADTPDPP